VTRRYRMKARTEAAEATRRRVLEAARATILDGPAPSLSMGEVARRAGVARSTLYSQYGSQAGLIGAVMVDAGLRAGFERVLELFNLPDAAEAMRHALPEGARMIGSDYELTRRIRVLAQLDPEVMAGQQTGNEYRAGGMRYQAGRLAEQHKLRPGVSPERAAMLLWLLTEVATYDGLHTTWGMDSEQIGEFVESVASRYLLRD
jgi:AcrR family transcriptional regulator